MFSESRIANANCLLDKMYRRMSRDFGAEQFMQFPIELMRGAVNHRWGISPFHYIEDYYLVALDMLTSLKNLQKSHGAELCEDATLPSSPTVRLCDYDRWHKPVFTYPSLDVALETGFPRDGIYRILIGVESIDLMIQGSEILRAGRGGQPLLVPFSGAVSNRNDQRAPFFSGLGLSEALKLPLLAVSDPTMARSGDVSLAWYAGNDHLPNLPDLIAEIVDHFSETFSCKPLLIGGSGGGFAVLSVLPRLRLRATGLVWNPQTSIGEYGASAVASYLRAAFPRSADENGLNGDASDEVQRFSIQAILAESGIDHDLTGREKAGIGELLYLQNRGDWHLLKHAGPYLRTATWERLSAHSFRQKQGEMACWFGKWGTGHAVPPKAMLEKILAALAGGNSASQVAVLLDDKEGVEEPLVWFDVDGAPFLTALAEWRDGQVLARCELGASKGGYAPECAFYLLVDGQRVDARWYSNEPCACFSHAGGGDRLDVIAFIRDSLGNIRTARAPVPPRPVISVSEEAIQVHCVGAEPGAHEIRPAATFPESEADDAKAYWSSLDAASHATYTKRQEWSEALAKELARHSPKSVFEFGCNAGKNLLAMRDRMPNTLLAGVDVNRAAVAVAKGFGLNVQVSDESSLKELADGAFDVAFTVSVLDHLPHPEVALKELARISRIAVYLLEPWLGDEGKVVRNYNRALSRDIETTPYSYSWDYQELVKRTLPNWSCVSRPMPLPTNLGLFYFLFELVPAHA